MNTLYVRCQTKDYILDIVAARAGMTINKDNSLIFCLQLLLSSLICPLVLLTNTLSIQITIAPFINLSFMS